MNLLNDKGDFNDARRLGSGQQNIHFRRHVIRVGNSVDRVEETEIIYILDQKSFLSGIDLPLGYLPIRYLLLRYISVLYLPMGYFFLVGRHPLIENIDFLIVLILTIGYSHADGIPVASARIRLSRLYLAKGSEISFCSLKSIILYHKRYGQFRSKRIGFLVRFHDLQHYSSIILNQFVFFIMNLFFTSLAGSLKPIL